MSHKPVPLDDQEERTWHELVQVTVRLMARLDRELREYGLTLGEYEVLAFLDAAPARRIRMAELAARALVSKGNLTARVGRLEQRDLVRREADQVDGRVVWAVLTAAGRAARRRAYPTHLNGVRRYVVEPIAGDIVPVDRALANVLCALDARDKVPD